MKAASKTACRLGNQQGVMNFCDGSEDENFRRIWRYLEAMLLLVDEAHRSQAASFWVLPGREFAGAHVLEDVASQPHQLRGPRGQRFFLQRWAPSWRKRTAEAPLRRMTWTSCNTTRCRKQQDMQQSSEPPPPKAAWFLGGPGAPTLQGSMVPTHLGVLHIRFIRSVPKSC